MTLLTDDELREIVRRIQAGEDLEENARRLFERFRPAVFRVFEKYGFSHDECRDLTQDVFVRVFKSIAEFRGDAKFESWVFEIAANIFKNEIRRRRTGKRLGQELSLDAASDPESPSFNGFELPSQEPDALAELEGRERSQKLRHAIAQLPTQMRQCCELRYGQGLKYQEIATLMKISIDTVKAHLHQARKRLKAEIGQEP